MATKNTKAITPFKLGAPENVASYTDDTALPVNPQHNNMPAQLDAKQAKAIATVAFHEYDEGSRKIGTATQRLAYAIMAYHTWLRHDGVKIGELTELIDFPGKPKSKATIVDVTERLTLEFIGPGLNFKNTTLTSDAIATAKEKRTAYTVLLRRAMQLAAILASHHVTADSYDIKHARFVVPVAAIKPANHFVKGWLASGGPHEGPVQTLAVSGRTVTMEEKVKDSTPERRIQVSVNQIMAAYRSFLPKSTPSVPERDDGASVVMLVNQLHAILCAKDADANESNLADAFPKATRDKLNELAQWTLKHMAIAANAQTAEPAKLESAAA